MDFIKKIYNVYFVIIRNVLLAKIVLHSVYRVAIKVALHVNPQMCVILAKLDILMMVVAHVLNVMQLVKPVRVGLIQIASKFAKPVVQLVYQDTI